jgi:hypothetical protein
MTQPQPTAQLYPDPVTAVRAIAALSAAPILVTVVRAARGRVRAGATQLDPAQFYQHGASFLLNALADARRQYPGFAIPAEAYAFTLPERDIAYLVDLCGMVTTIAVGPDPHDHPNTREDVLDGLHALVRTDPHHQPPTHRPFPALHRIDPTHRASAPPPSPSAGRHRRR